MSSARNILSGLKKSKDEQITTFRKSIDGIQKANTTMKIDIENIKANISNIGIITDGAQSNMIQMMTILHEINSNITSMKSDIDDLYNLHEMQKDEYSRSIRDMRDMYKKHTQSVNDKNTKELDKTLTELKLARSEVIQLREDASQNYELFYR